MLKPRSFLLYFLGLITCFFIGLSYAGLVEAGKHQGLAGGAIVLGYGVVASGIGLILALFAAWKANGKTVFRLNIILALCILAFITYVHFKYQERQDAKQQENLGLEQSTTPIKQVLDNKFQTCQPDKKQAPTTYWNLPAGSLYQGFINGA